MPLDTALRARRRRAATFIATFVALVAGCSASPVDQGAAAPARAGVGQNTNADPCRFATADAVGSAFGRRFDHDVQIETTIQPLPRDAMIAVGTRIMETLARK
jgi:hypothetical protein